MLIALEQKLQVKSGNPQVRLADFFADTSTGAILTSIYLCPEAVNSRKARFSAQQAINLYVENGGKIFMASLRKQLQSGNRVLDEKYEAEKLEKALRTYLRGLRLSQLLKSCIIPAYDIEKRRHYDAQQRAAAHKLQI